MAMSAERMAQMQLQAANEQFNQGKWVSRVGTGVELIGGGVVAYEAASAFGLLDALGRFMHDVGMPFLTKYASFLVPAGLGLLTFVLGGFIANRGRRTMTEAAAMGQAAVAH